ncbi:MAG: MmgE/PrpD family protein [Lentisphaeria bacterium]|nr:MmgE/PrpD family protein [Lentisphaeria bacterium]
MQGKTLTLALCENVLGPWAEQITPSARAAGRKMILDSLGCAMAARHAPGIGEILDMVRTWGGAPEATVLLHGDRLPAPHAAFVNSALIHALDYDDIHIPGTLHILSIILPTALAAGEMAGASGVAFLDAVILGVETAGRLAIAEAAKRRGDGFLPSSLAGGFGAVAAAARLLDLSLDEAVSAMGIAYAQASGNRQALLDMTLTKRIQPAFAVRAALWSVALARRGFSGPPAALEGRAGYFGTYLNGPACSAEELLVPRPRFEIERLVVKPYTSCGACHSVQAAAERLVREEGLRPRDIEQVGIFGVGPGGLVGGRFEVGNNPQVSAQFSVTYGVALALLRGPMTVASLTDERVREDHDVAELARRIAFVPLPEDLPPPPERPADYPAYSTRYHGVLVTTRDGRRLMRCQCPAQTFAPGAHTFAQVCAKFRECAAFAGFGSEADVDAVIRCVTELEESPDLEPLIRSMIDPIPVPGDGSSRLSATADGRGSVDTGAE